MKKLTNTIRECRKERAINQEELAEAVGIPRETIGRLERGMYQNPSYRMVYRISAYFERSVEDVFRFSETEEAEAAEGSE